MKAIELGFVAAVMSFSDYVLRNALNFLKKNFILSEGCWNDMHKKYCMKKLMNKMKVIFLKQQKRKIHDIEM